MAFIGQSVSDIKRKLQRLEGLHAMALQDLVREAEKVYHKRETEEEKKERKKCEEERENKRNRRQEKNLSRILAEVVGEHERNSRAENRQTGYLGNRESRSGGRRPTQKFLEKDRGAYCKEKGHWTREWP
jgi:RNA:NAD 2'-phosphotransferase (TPT1/KptA family)